MWRNWNSSTMVVGMKNCSTAVEKSLAVPQRVKHIITIKLSNSILKSIPKRNENIHPHRNLYTNVYGNIIHKSQKVRLLATGGGL